MNRPTRLPNSEVHYKCEGTSDDVGCYLVTDYFTAEHLRWYIERWMCHNCFGWINRPIKFKGGIVVPGNNKDLPSWKSLETLKEYHNSIAY